MSVIPHLVVTGADRAVAFYRDAFGAEEVFRIPNYDARMLHVESCGGHLFLCEQIAGGAPGRDADPLLKLQLAVVDCDAAYERATAAGAVGLAPPADTSAGERCAKVADPFGHEWSLSRARAA